MKLTSWLEASTFSTTCKEFKMYQISFHHKLTQFPTLANFLNLEEASQTAIYLAGNSNFHSVFMLIP
jgi:hypothetical protein